MPSKLASPGALTPDRRTLVEANKLLSSAGVLDRTVVANSQRRSRVVLIGPFAPQLFELSSSESGISDTSSSDGSMTGTTWEGSSSPTTPTCRRRRPQALTDSPSAGTDWITYGETEEGYEDLSFNRSYISESDVSGCFPIDVERDVDSDEASDVSSSVPILFKEGSSYHNRLPLNSHSDTGSGSKAVSLGFDIRGHLPPKIRPSPSKLTPIVITPHTLALQEAPISGEPTPGSATTTRDAIVDSLFNPSGGHVCNETDLLSLDEYICSACEGRSKRMIYLLPCRDLACPPCFSSSVAAVSVTQGVSKCPACLTPVTSFEPYLPSKSVPIRAPSRRKNDQVRAREYQTVVMRIDNVAWDIEPYIVETFLPPDSLPRHHPHPIHICLDRRDGRTKDYLVASAAAARRVLQLRQNVYMCGGKITGGRKRAVTVSQVTHEELIRELRPGSKAELLSLLELCEATLTTPTPQLRLDSSGRGRLHASVGSNGKVHYIKYRHAPFHALISIMIKLCGRDSPAYWDVYHVATGAISALSSSVKSQQWDSHGDRVLLQRLIATFDSTFDKTRKVHHHRSVR